MEGFDWSAGDWSRYGGPSVFPVQINGLQKVMEKYTVQEFSRVLNMKRASQWDVPKQL